MNQPDNLKLAAALVGGTPMAFRAYPDGSFVVIGPDGRKFQFTKQEVEKMQAERNTSSPTKRASVSSHAKKPAAQVITGSGKNTAKKTPSSTKR